MFRQTFLVALLALASSVAAQDLSWAAGSLAETKEEAARYAQEAAAGESLDDKISGWWSSWKIVYNKNYTPEQETVSFNNFKVNMLRMLAVNTDFSVSFWQSGNQYSDLDYSTFASIYLMKQTALDSIPAPDFNDTMTRRLSRRLMQAGRLPAGLPSKIDWRTTGQLTPVKDQGGCGSCWAFSASAILESAYLIATKSRYDESRPLDLSEQHLVDCATSANGFYSYGCDGGDSGSALSFVNRMYAAPESVYPYTEATGRCRLPSGSRVPAGSVQLNSRPVFPRRNSVFDLMAAIVTGPTVIYFNVVDDFYGYAGGIYQPNAQCMRGNVNHAMVAVGYNYDALNPRNSYWIIQNSWGPMWGENGFVQVAMTANGVGPCLMYTYSVRTTLTFNARINTATFPAIRNASNRPIIVRDDETEESSMEMSEASTAEKSEISEMSEKSEMSETSEKSEMSETSEKSEMSETSKETSMEESSMKNTNPETSSK